MRQKRQTVSELRAQRHRSLGPTPTTGQVEALDSIFNEAVALFHRMRVAAEEVHRQGEMSAGRRGVLRGLDRLGPQTVPQMARARPVSRQHVQMLVNQLARDGLVEYIENPAHKRSHLVRLTQQGKELVESMVRRELRVLGQLSIQTSEKDLTAAADVLRSVRALLQSHEWKRALKSVR